MRDFIRSENVKHYHRLLERTTDEPERQRIKALLAEEEAAAESAPLADSRQSQEGR